MNSIKKLFRPLFSVLASLLLIAAPAFAQSPTPIFGNQSVSLSLTVNASVSLVCTPSAITFSYTGGVGTASSQISCTFSYNVPSGYTFIDWAAYLAGGPTSGLSGPTAIPTSNIFSSNDGNSPVPCTINLPSIFGSTTGVGCYTLVPASSNVSGTSGSQTHTFLLSVNQSNLAAGVYTGSLNVVADIQ